MNIDFSEKIITGIKGDATKLSKFILLNSVDELVCSNPYLGTGFIAEDYFKEVSKIIKIGKKFVLNGQKQNKFFNEVDKKLIEKYGFQIEHFQVPLLDRFKNFDFFTTSGSKISNDNMFSTVLIKVL